MGQIRINSLRRRLAIQIGLMVVGLLLLSMAAFAGINALHHDFGDALRGYQQLREVYEIGSNVTTARAALRAEPVDTSTAHAAIEAAMLKLDASPTGFDDPSLRASLKDAITTMRPAALDSALARLAALSAGIRTSIQDKQQAADQKRQLTLTAVLSLCVVVVGAGIVVGVQQYRGVMRPLRKLGDAVRQVAAGNFGQPITEAGDREFVSLAHDFNRMANELDTFYRELEQKVAAKSKELVRSERLASVGYLAAGVAHEINNPLSIITGYAERLLQHLDRDAGSGDALERTRKALAVICEEAFRCKRITDRLLSLARPGNEDFGPVSLPAVADEVISSVGGLAEFSDRRIILESGPRELMLVSARDGEMKQMILNLVINALQAVEPGVGQVRITIARKNDQVELAVADNGRGMTAQTLDRAFEPFFTHNRGAGDSHGTGLGLSITYAIVVDHHGTIAAESDGPGRGSRLVVRIPALPQGADHVRDRG
jgi:two-component system, NtrC family, sensor kinase